MLEKEAIVSINYMFIWYGVQNIVMRFCVATFIIRCRNLIRQTCDTLDVQILKGVVSKDHIHLHISYSPKLSISDILKRLKGRSARILLEEYSELKKRYWGGHLWGIGYEAWSIGDITDEMI